MTNEAIEANDAAYKAYDNREISALELDRRLSRVLGFCVHDHLDEVYNPLIDMQDRITEMARSKVEEIGRRKLELLVDELLASIARQALADLEEQLRRTGAHERANREFSTDTYAKQLADMENEITAQKEWYIRAAIGHTILKFGITYAENVLLNKEAE